MRARAASLAACVLFGCTGSISATGSGDDSVLDSGTGTSGSSQSDLTFCVDETNRYRAMVGKPALALSLDVQAYAKDGAMVDQISGQPHKHFSDTQGGGLASAENECPGILGWTIQGTVRDTIAACLLAFWREGPGTGDAHGHYNNLIGDFAVAGCGVYVDGDAITITQDFGP